MKKYLLSLLVVVSITTGGFSQQEFQNSHFMLQQYVLNPAFTGYEGLFTVNILHREQWLGLSDGAGNYIAPRTSFFGMESPIRIANSNSGLGFYVMQDRLGFEINRDINVCFAHNIPTKAKGVFRVGLTLNSREKQIDFTKFEAINKFDPLLSKIAQQSALQTDGILGVAYFYDYDKYIGFSVSRVLSRDFEMESAEIDIVPHYYLQGSYAFNEVYDEIDIIPAFHIKSDIASTQYDLAVRGRYRKMLFLGLHYRSTDAVAISAGIDMGNTYFGYSYDVTTSKLASFSGGSHEIILIYRFEWTDILEREITIYNNTRYPRYPRGTEEGNPVRFYGHIK